ncbi:MAG: hypothetical protein AAF944_03120 [Bacteroidota bacterium]
MKTLFKTLIGLSLMLCLTTGCDLLNYDEIETEVAPGGDGGGGDDDPCKEKECD